MSEKSSPNTIYLPFCKLCNGLLNINIDSLTFSIQYECELNKEHHSNNNIFFKTFERFYLKEKKINNNLESSIYHICNSPYFCKCSKNYIDKNCQCEKIKKCLRHNKDFNYYCINCKTHLCIYCIKENNIHKNHKIKNFIEIMPSLEDIENLKKSFNEKLQYTNELIKKIDNWERLMIRKAEELKQSLRDEISFFEKIICNYNYLYNNYTYFQLFYTINKYIKNINNEYLIKFNECYEFEKQTEILIQLFKYLGKKSKEIKCIRLKRTFESIYSDVNKIEKIKDIYYLDYIEKKIRLCYYNKPDNSLYHNTNSIIEFKESIYSISISTIEDKICICLLNNKNVKIIDYDIDDKSFELNNEEIKDNSESNINHFYKCIQITKINFITSDDKYIKIWSNNSNNYLEIKKIKLNTKTYDLLLINNEYFISSQP